jgi:hypothetical protein
MKTVETVSGIMRPLFTRLKPGVNEKLKAKLSHKTQKLVDNLTLHQRI